MSRTNLLILVFLGAMFGASFLYMRVAAPAVGPWTVAFIRVGLAAVVLAVFVGRPGIRAVARDWRPLLLLGVANNAIPFGMYAFAETVIPASLAAILNAMTPMAMALAAATWLGQSLTARKVAGIAFGVAGVATVVGFGPLTLDGPTLVAIGACLIAVCGYAVGFTYARRRVPHVDPVTISLGQLVGAALILTPGAVLTLPSRAIDLDVAASLVALAVFSTALAWPLLFRLVHAIGPTASSTVTFLAPAFGIAWGAAVLGEPLGPSLLVGAGLILVSVALVAGLHMPASVHRFVDGLWTTRATTTNFAESRG